MGCLKKKMCIKNNKKCVCRDLMYMTSNLIHINVLVSPDMMNKEFESQEKDL